MVRPRRASTERNDPVSRGEKQKPRAMRRRSSQIRRLATTAPPKAKTFGLIVFRNLHSLILMSYDIRPFRGQQAILDLSRSTECVRQAERAAGSYSRDVSANI